MNILIVDDEPVLHELLKDIFKLYGHEVVGNAYDGVEALRIFRTLVLSYKKPDVIIMDHRMPKKDGVETSAEMLEIDHSIKILFVSADESARQRALEIGAVDFIKKPFEISEILSAIEKLTEEIKKADQIEKV
ncbi:response regulator [candidate division WOR-3 bacterium]|nr:response regulator [candidate division WOR-3 bacterium]